MTLVSLAAKQKTEELPGVLTSKFNVGFCAKLGVLCGRLLFESRLCMRRFAAIARRLHGAFERRLARGDERRNRLADFRVGNDMSDAVL